MHPYLMGSARFQTAFDIRIFPETVKYAEMGNGIPAVLVIDSHTLSVLWMSADGGVYSPCFFFDNTMYNGGIIPCNRMLL